MAEDNNNEENVQVDPNTTTTTPAKAPPADHGPVGCYLVYEPSSGGRLMLQYSKGPIPPNSVGFWTSPHKLPEFKFKQAAGRSELIKGIAGGDANRRKYFSGWCQFIKLAKQKQARVIQFTPPDGQFVPVDVYAMDANNATVQLDLKEGLASVDDYVAVAVMAQHHAFLRGVKTLAPSNFLELGNLAGASTRM